MRLEELQKRGGGGGNRGEKGRGETLDERTTWE